MLRMCWGVIAAFGFVGAAWGDVVETASGIAIRDADAVVAEMAWPVVPGERSVKIEAVEDGFTQVTLTWQLDRAVQQDDLAANFDLKTTPNFW